MKRLLVALDRSDESSFVLARAVELADALGGKLRLLAVVELPPIEGAEATLRERELEVPPALRDGIVVEVGIVPDVVCSVARSYNADLVVIGAHRHGLLTRVLGTTAAVIVNRIDRPVIVVRPMPIVAEASAPTATESASQPPHHGRRHDEHPILEASTLTGAAVGAAVGAAAGPPGAVLGGVIGVGVGLLAGEVLEHDPPHVRRRRDRK